MRRSDWDYAELSKIASRYGGPEKYKEHLTQKGFNKGVTSTVTRITGLGLLYLLLNKRVKYSQEKKAKEAAEQRENYLKNKKVNKSLTKEEYEEYILLFNTNQYENLIFLLNFGDTLEERILEQYLDKFDPEDHELILKYIFDA